MSPNVMMECGCRAQGTDQEGKPVCVVHFGLTPAARIVASPPDLTGRTAKCDMCGREKPSSLDLPFFQYQGPGSALSREQCRHCGYLKGAHSKFEGMGCWKWVYSPKAIKGTHVEHSLGTTFEPLSEGKPYDSYYCGCRGWD